MALELYQNSLRIPLPSPPFTELRSEKLTNTSEIDVCALYFILQHFVAFYLCYGSTFPIGILSVELGGEDDIRNLQEFRSELLKKTKIGCSISY